MALALALSRLPTSPDAAPGGAEVKSGVPSDPDFSPRGRKGGAEAQPFHRLNQNVVRNPGKSHSLRHGLEGAAAAVA